MIAVSRVSGTGRAKRAAWVALALWLSWAPVVVADDATATPVNLVLALDDSQATAAADPDRRLITLLRGLLADLPAGSRVALMTYDDLATPLVPLTTLADGGVRQVTDALQGMGFAARFSNSAAGLERAIYELTQVSDAAARRVVLLQQSSPIGVGDPDKDLSFRRWAMEVLASKAANAGIELTVISLGRDADLALGSALAARTAGVALVAATPDSLSEAVAAVRRRISSADRLAAAPAPQIQVSLPEDEPTTATPAIPAVADEPVVRAEAEPRLTRIDELDRLPEPAAGPVVTFAAAHNGGLRLPALPPFAPDHPFWQGTAIAVSLLVLTVALTWGVRRRRGRTPTLSTGQQAPVTGARLVDVGGVSGRDAYPLSGKLARISRAPGPDTDNVVTVHIPHDVISRSHAFIELRQGVYWVTDPGSNNGTFVNDGRVEGSRRLRHGDRIRFASFEFRFEHSDRGEAAAASEIHAAIGTGAGARTVAIGRGAAATRVFDPGSAGDRTTVAPDKPHRNSTQGAARSPLQSDTGDTGSDSDQDPTIVRPTG